MRNFPALSLPKPRLEYTAQFEAIKVPANAPQQNVICIFEVQCLKVFKKHNFDGVLCLECGGEVLSEKSFKWLSEQVASL